MNKFILIWGIITTFINWMILIPFFKDLIPILSIIWIFWWLFILLWNYYKEYSQENKKLLWTFRSYEEIRRKFDILMFKLTKIYLVTISKEELSYIRTELDMIFKEFFKNILVTENENIYILWKERENKVLIYLNQYSMPDWLVWEENGIEYTISNEWRKNKLTELENYIRDSDNLLQIQEEKILK